MWICTEVSGDGTAVQIDGSVCHFEICLCGGWSPSLSIDYNTDLSDNKTEKVRSWNLAPAMLAQSFVRQRR